MLSYIVLNQYEQKYTALRIKDFYEIVLNNNQQMT